jgi:hypothetical protein
MRFVCFRCGHRQEQDTRCASCSNDIVQDLGDRSTWRHLRDIEGRLGKRRQAKIVGIAAVLAALVGAALFSAAVSYYAPRGEHAPRNVVVALVAATLGVGLAVAAALDRTWGKKRLFSFLDQEDEIRAALAAPPGTGDEPRDV